VLARACIADRARGDNAARLFSIMMIIGGVAPVVAPLMGGALLGPVGWRGIFWVLTAAGVVMFAGVLVLVPETLPEENRHGGGLRALVRNLRYVVGNRVYLGYAFTFMFGFVALFSYISASPFVVQNVLGLSPGQFSMVFAVNAAGMVGAAIVNTRLVGEGERPRGLLELTEPRWQGKVVMARPQFGTSSTQAACLFEVLGPERAREYYRGLKANGVQVAPGNKQVAEWVGQGRTPRGDVAAVGVTDTDDALGEIEVGQPVAMTFPDRERKGNDRMGTLFIPNSLGILKGGPNPEGARRLVDYLLGPEVERRLAESAGHQIPLNPEVTARLPASLETPATAHAMRVDFGRAADLWEEVQAFLRQEFAQG
jgi:ABC-type Fe3+ transport system substrate-binding protein